MCHHLYDNSFALLVCLLLALAVKIYFNVNLWHIVHHLWSFATAQNEEKEIKDFCNAQNEANNRRVVNCFTFSRIFQNDLVRMNSILASERAPSENTDTHTQAIGKLAASTFVIEKIFFCFDFFRWATWFASKMHRNLFFVLLSFIVICRSGVRVAVFVLFVACNKLVLHAFSTCHEHIHSPCAQMLQSNFAFEFEFEFYHIFSVRNEQMWTHQQPK